MQSDWHYWEGSWRQRASCVGLGRGEGLYEGYGCGRRAGTERFLCLCLGGHVGQVGGVGNWFGERLGRVGGRERGARCWGLEGHTGVAVGGGGTVVCGLTTYVFWEGVEGAQALKELCDSGCVDQDVGRALSGGLSSREVVNKGVSHGWCCCCCCCFMVFKVDEQARFALAVGTFGGGLGDEGGNAAQERGQ